MNTCARRLPVLSSTFFAYFSKWSPRALRDSSGSPTASYLRLGVTPWVPGWDLGAGLQVCSGIPAKGDHMTTFMLCGSF